MPPTDAWVQDLRSFLGSRNSAHLDECIEHLQDQPDLREMVEAYRDKKGVRQKLEQWIDDQGRHASPVVLNAVELLRLDVYALYMTALPYLPADRQSEALEQGIQACEEAVRISKELNDAACAAHFMELLGEGYTHLQRYDEAEASFRGAIAFREKLHEQSQDQTLVLIGIWNKLGTLLWQRTRYDEADAAFRHALSLCENTHVTLSTHALVLRNLGMVLRDRGSWKEAENTLVQAVEMRRRHDRDYPQATGADLAKALSNLGLVLVGQGRFFAAADIFKEAIGQVEARRETNRMNYDPVLAVLWNNLGHTLMPLERFVEAEEAFLRALELYKRLHASHAAPYASSLTMTRCNLGNVLRNQSRMSEAEAVLREARLLCEQLYSEQPEVYGPDLAMIWCNLGTLLQDDSRISEAEEAFRRALAVYRTLHEDQPDTYARDLYLTLNDVGVTLRSQSRLADAAIVLQEALSLCEPLHDSEPSASAADLSSIWLSLGNVFLDQEDDHHAEHAFQKAIRISPDPHFDAALRSRGGLGAIYARRQRLAETYALWSEVLELVEKKRTSLRRSRDRSVLHDTYMPHFESLISLCLTRGQLAEAWYWTERRKARTLLDQFASARPRLTNEDQEARYREWEKAQQELAGLLYGMEARNMHTSNMAIPTQIEAALSAQKTRVQELRRDLSFTHGSAWTLVDAKVPAPEDLARSLQAYVEGSRTLLVQFISVDETGYSVMLLPLWKVVEGEPLPLLARHVVYDEPGRLESFTRAFDEVLASLRSGDTATAAHEMALLPESLGKMFFHAWQDELDRMQPESLLLVPDGPLHDLPLHAALLLDGRPIVDVYPVSYSGSSSIPCHAPRLPAETVRPKGRLVMGPANPPDHDSYRSMSDAETMQLAGQWGTPRYAFEEMSIDVLRRHARQTEILHLATHSIFDPDDYLNSYIAFNREHLTLFELTGDARLDFTGMRLCYLSSCESGISHTGRSDDLQGLVWALMYAGAEAVLASLWPVEDEASALMARWFYSGLDDGLSLSEAFQEAVAALRKESDFASPLFWAPFVLYGNGFAEVHSHVYEFS